ncbi:MAG: ribosomal RNA small subunit methyltransferase A [Anaerolineales bacterium]|nr:ribosomal RNA small subunit methyltransferase A [Anaerolineales bacterium]
MSQAVHNFMQSTEPLPPLNVPALLRSYGIHPDKSLGQNFLVESSWLQNIIEIAEISNEISILEVGAGLGSLTRYLAEKAKTVVAVELDGRLLHPLESVLSCYQNVRIVKGDILALDPDHLIESDDYLVVANIPYYITSSLIRHLLEARQRPTRMILTLQLEVAERICAKPNRMSLLALSVQVYGHPQVKARIPASAFYPSPKVDSAIVRVDIYPTPAIPDHNIETFFRLAKAGFSQKRKTLRNALSGGMAWPKDNTENYLRSAGIDPNRRAETLNLNEWNLLAQQVKNQTS